MHRQPANRPALKITRHADEPNAASFTFEVWNPFVASYQPVTSVETGLGRIDQLARLIRQMRLYGHQKQDQLTDVPDADRNGHGRWAEFRVSATTYRSYDTRRTDRPRWVRAIGKLEAVEATCTSVGYALQMAHAA
jgi:hypothetical protein